jgi:uncharacterized protein
VSPVNTPSGSGHPLASRVRSILRGLMGSTDAGIRAAAAITTDGMVIAAVLQEGVDADRFAAMSASLLALAEREVAESRRGLLKQLLLEGTEGAVLLVRAGDDAVLAISTDPGALIGNIFIKTKASAENLRQLLESK